MKILLALILILPYAGIAKAGQHSGVGTGSAPAPAGPQGGTPPSRPIFIQGKLAPSMPILGVPSPHQGASDSQDRRREQDNPRPNGR